MRREGASYDRPVATAVLADEQLEGWSADLRREAFQTSLQGRDAVTGNDAHADEGLGGLRCRAVGRLRCALPGVGGEGQNGRAPYSVGTQRPTIPSMPAEARELDPGSVGSLPAVDSTGLGAQGRPRKILDQLVALTSSDLRARYGRGRWRLVKWLIDPFALVGVYLLLVTFIFYRRPDAVGLSLACAVIPFQLTAMIVANSLDALRLRRSIIANMRFPRTLLPVATALTEAVGFSASLVLLGALMGAYGIAPTLTLLWLPLILAISLALGVAVAYPATLIGVWAPDLRGLVLSAVRAAFFLAPGLIPLSRIDGLTNDLVRLNPLSGLFEAMRHAVLYQTAPPAWSLLYPLAAAALILAVFLPLYRRDQQHFAKVVE